MENLMMILGNLLNKGMFLVLFMSIFYSLRHAILFTLSALKSKKYEIKRKQLLYLGLSISFILTIMFSGINLI